MYKSVGWCVKYSEMGGAYGLYLTELEAKSTAKHAGGSARAVEIFEKVNKYDEWTIDMPCYTTDGRCFHFAGMAEHGMPKYWADGKTSHTGLVTVIASSLLSVEEYEALRE